MFINNKLPYFSCTLAINLIVNRLEKQFNLSQKKIKINIDGIPKDLRGAKNLAERDRFEFQYWALSLVNAMPLRSKERMRGADRGIDGTIVIRSSENKFERIIVEVKSGHVQRNNIATLKGDMKREKAIGGLFITLEEPTREMKREVNVEGFFKVGYTEYPKMQIITIKELLQGKKPDLPSIHKVYKEAQETKIKKGKQKKLF